MTETLPLRVGPRIGAHAFSRIRRKMELSHFKWDAQVGDVTTLTPYALLITPSTWNELARLAEALTRETLAMEAELLGRLELHAELALPRPLRELLRRGEPTPSAVRTMRFDFHYTTDGWRISEVNSDVPGGFTEASAFTQYISNATPGARPAGDPTKAIVDAMEQVIDRSGKSGVVALMNAPGHMEDHQVVAHLASSLCARGLITYVTTPAELRWNRGEAVAGACQASRPDAIVRFYQVEWLARLRRTRAWHPLFSGGRTPVNNPGSSALTESKRLPLVWDRLRSGAPTWKRLLPETRALSDAPWTTDDGWLVKSAFSNTGDTVSIREAMSSRAWRWRMLEARLQHRSWLAQRRFHVLPLAEEHDGERTNVFPCIGVYTVDGVASGIYGRLSSGAVVDAYARDVAVLIEEGD